MARVGDSVTGEVALLFASSITCSFIFLKPYTAHRVMKDEPHILPSAHYQSLRHSCSLFASLLLFPKMELCCRRMRVPLSLLTHSWPPHGSRSTIKPMARRYFGLEAAKEGQSQKRTAIVTGSSRGMYVSALSLVHHVSNILILTQMCYFSVVKLSLAVLLTMDMPSLLTTSQPTRPV